MSTASHQYTMTRGTALGGQACIIHQPRLNSLAEWATEINTAPDTSDVKTKSSVMCISTFSHAENMKYLPASHDWRHFYTKQNMGQPHNTDHVYHIQTTSTTSIGVTLESFHIPNTATFQ